MTGVGCKRPAISTAAPATTNATTNVVAMRLCFTTSEPEIINVTTSTSKNTRPQRPASRSGLITNTSAHSEIVISVSPRSPDQNSLIFIWKIAVRDCCGSLFMKGALRHRLPLRTRENYRHSRLSQGKLFRKPGDAAACQIDNSPARPYLPVGPRGFERDGSFYAGWRIHTTAFSGLTTPGPEEARSSAH